MDSNIDVLSLPGKSGKGPGWTDLPKGFVLHHVM